MMRSYLSLVKFSHTIFALPFALIGFFLAYHISEMPFEPMKIVFVVLCMITARNAAMAFNRWLDRDIDLNNPRTAKREIPNGTISADNALIFVIVNAVLFIIITYFINPLCFYLSPIALLVILGYSYTKRYTYLCHVILGLGLALAPLGAYLAVLPSFDLLPIMYGMAVLCWVAGFDMIYALQDDTFDNQHQLYSIPARFGRANALSISTWMHALSWGLLLFIWWTLFKSASGVGYLHLTAVLIFGGLLIYQHSLVKHDDLSKVNLAFFTTNGIASALFAGLVILDFYI